MIFGGCCQIEQSKGDLHILIDCCDAGESLDFRQTKDNMYPQQFPPSAPPASTNFSNAGPVSSDERIRKFQYLVDRYEINREFATRLRGLEGYEIVFIVDGRSLFPHVAVFLSQSTFPCRFGIDEYSSGRYHGSFRSKSNAMG